LSVGPGQGSMALPVKIASPFGVLGYCSIGALKRAENSKWQITMTKVSVSGMRIRGIFRRYHIQ
jgi:hypothetical protein